MMFFELGLIDTGTVVETVAKSRRTELDEIEVTGEVFGQNNQVFPDRSIGFSLLYKDTRAT